jgi:hypothetical protein
MLCCAIMEKKSKGRFREYNDYCFYNFGCKAPILEIPNDTCVSGTYRMFLSCIKAKKLLILFCANCKNPEVFKNIQLNTHDWQLLSEMEAVMRNCHNLAVESLIEAPGYNCFSYYSVLHCRSNLNCIRQLQCYDVRRSWSPITPLKDIDTIGLEKQLLCKETQEFIERLNNEYKRYFPAPDDDQKVMMVFHPYIVWNGFK